MNMKKIIAGVAAAALTVTSLAVVSVSAEDTTKTYNLVGEKGNITFTYSKSVNFRGGIAPFAGWTDEDGNAATEYLFNKIGNVEFGYANDGGSVKLSHGDSVITASAQAMENEINSTIMNGVNVGKGLTIEVTGTNAKGNPVTAKAKASIEKNGKELFIVRVANDGGSFILNDNELDLIDFVSVKSMTMTEEFSVDTGKYLVSSGLGCVIEPGVGLTNAISTAQGWQLTCWWANVTGNKSNTDGRTVNVGVPYGFGGVLDDSVVHTIVIDGGDLGYLDFGYNTLRWINDNIEQNKGAVLRINFMTPNQTNALDVITGGNGDNYITEEDTWKGDWNVPVLTPGSASSTVTSEEDIAIAVNIKNTSRLQQSATINTEDKNNMYVDFDWDKLVQNSASTVSGNVDSIHFRVLDTKNVRDNLKPTGKNIIGVKSIQIIVPDQTTIPGGNVSYDDQITSVEDEVSGVKAEGTNKAIRGNGGSILVATGKLTTNKLSYEVKLLNKDSIPVQPAGEITLTLPIPKDNQGKTIKGGTVAHTKGDGTVENLTILNDYKADGFVKVVTTSLSPFEMEFEDDETSETEAPAPTETEAPAPTETEAPTTQAPAGDKNANTGVAIAIVPAVIAAAGVIISKKRK